MELTKEYFDNFIKELTLRLDRDQMRIEGKFTELPTQQDLNSLKSVIDDIKETVTRIDQRTDEDTRAALKDIVKLQKRVTALEQKLDLQTH